jgi:peptidase S41-like protein
MNLRNKSLVRDTAARAVSRIRAPSPLALKTFIRAESLSWVERLNIVDALSQTLAGVYVHLPLKRSLYGFDVIRGLEHLRQQLPRMTDLEFHRELTSLMNRLRDAHTQYQGRWTGNNPVASLPFLVESYVDKYGKIVYVVSKIDRPFIPDRHFVKGVTLDYWNGIPFDRAVDLHAESETGGRPDARRARALESLTFRALEHAPPPNEEWVVLDYRDLMGKRRQLQLDWMTFDPGRAPTASRASLGTRIRSGIDAGAEAVRRAKKYRFNPKLWRDEAKQARVRKAGGGAAFADFLSKRVVNTKKGRFGYLRIWSFDVNDDDAFLRAAISLLRGLPDRGLIIDLRSNPGGFIWAAERLLQLFTPNPITPTKFALRATPLTAAMAQAVFNQSELAPWAESLNTAQLTGEPYSSHLPITPPERCNDVGQHYGGPVLIVVDANTYSSGDLFAAGFLDNRIGPVVCVGEATGAGGANVWESDDLRAALGAAGQPLPQLPEGIRFRVAVRRAVRSNDADGTLIEDAGVSGQPYAMTRTDIFRSNHDLIEHCANLLTDQPRTRLDVQRQGRGLSVKTGGLDQLDVLVNGHPGGLPIKLRGDGRRRIALPADARVVEVTGFSHGVIRQKRRLKLADRS